MSKNDQRALQLAQELSGRVAKFQVFVYDREKDPAGIPQLVSPSIDKHNMWIKRSRSAPANEAVDSQTWTTEWSVENILDDLELVQDLKYRNVATDYYEFIIVDRTAGRTFDLLDVVADALSKINGDLPYDQVFSQAIQKYILFTSGFAYGLPPSHTFSSSTVPW